MTATPLHPLFAAELTGARPRRRHRRPNAGHDRAHHGPIRGHGAARSASRRRKAIGLRQPLRPARSGTADAQQGGRPGRPARIQNRNIFDVSNLDERGQILSLDDQRRAYRDGNQLWHTDSSFRQKSATWSMLHARIIPPDGADTEFADTRAAYDALPAATKTKLEGLIAEHSIWHSRAKLGGYTPTEEEKKLRPPARHPVVRRHPGSGRNALYIASHASHIIGWPVEEGRKLLEELLAFATQPRFVYRHKWRLGDLVIWDNRCTLHRATPFESATHVRDMRRSTVIDVRAEAMAS